MRESIRIGSVRGIAIRLHWSVLAVAGLLTWGLAATLLPEAAPGAGAVACWIAGALTVVAFFASLLAHELAHSIVAQGRGVDVDRITLWLLGGVAELHREVDRPRAELAVASAGPATSVLLTAGCLGIAEVVVALGGPDVVVAAFAWLALVNGLLAVFNVLPAAPLDGGRILHALVWARTGDRDRATRIATAAGRGLGYGLVALGVLTALAGAFAGIWFVLLGWFIAQAATAEATHALLEQALAGVRVRDVMTGPPVTVPGRSSVADLVDHAARRHRHAAFPVVDDDGRPIGLVTLRSLRGLSDRERADLAVGEVMTPIARVPRAAPADDLLAAVSALSPRAGGDGRLLVLDHEALVGIVSPTDLNRLLELAVVRRGS